MECIKRISSSLRRIKTIAFTFEKSEKILMEKIKNIIQSSIDVKTKILNDEKLLQTVNDCVKEIVKAFEKGKKVLFCGNGGSASDAQHLCAIQAGRKAARAVRDALGYATFRRRRIRSGQGQAADARCKRRRERRGAVDGDHRQGFAPPEHQANN